jgi:hypothetical protein
MRHNLPGLQIAHNPMPSFNASRSARVCAWRKLPDRKGCTFGIHYTSGLL